MCEFASKMLHKIQTVRASVKIISIPDEDQNRKSTDGYSKSIVRKNNDKLGKRIGLDK